jgi:putative transposase
VVGVPQHVIQRGNNRQVIFAGDGDVKAYVTWLQEYADKFCVAIHAWILIANQVSQAPTVVFS